MLSHILCRENFLKSILPSSNRLLSCTATEVENVGLGIFKKNFTVKFVNTNILQPLLYDISLGDKSRLRRQSKTQNEFESLLSSFDKENIAILNDIIVSFKVASEINVSKTNEYLKAFANNLKCDKNFMMYIISMDFSKNNELSYLVKRQMLGEIQGIIDKYNNLPDEQKKLEIYD